LLHGRARPRAPRPGLGFYISFSGILAFPKSDVIQEVARTIPWTACSWETDSPFLAPPPHRASATSPPSSSRWRRRSPPARDTVEEVGQASAANFRRLFGPPYSVMRTNPRQTGASSRIRSTDRRRGAAAANVEGPGSRRRAGPGRHPDNLVAIRRGRSLL
jgi:hypothetical protein